MFDSPIDWLINWLILRLIDWLIDLSFDFVISPGSFSGNWLPIACIKIPPNGRPRRNCSSTPSSKRPKTASTWRRRSWTTDRACSLSRTTIPMINTGVAVFFVLSAASGHLRRTRITSYLMRTCTSRWTEPRWPFPAVRSMRQLVCGFLSVYFDCLCWLQVVPSSLALELIGFTIDRTLHLSIDWLIIPSL